MIKSWHVKSVTSGPLLTSFIATRLLSFDNIVGTHLSKMIALYIPYSVSIFCRIIYARNHQPKFNIYSNLTPGINCNLRQLHDMIFLKLPYFEKVVKHFILKLAMKFYVKRHTLLSVFRLQLLQSFMMNVCWLFSWFLFFIKVHFNSFLFSFHFPSEE